MSATVATEVATLPPVVCADWCRDGNGHPDAWHPSDQYCTTDGQRIELEAEPLVTGTYAGTHYIDKPCLDVYLSREAYSIRALIHLSHNEETGPKLTPSEAIALGEILVRLGREAQA